MPSGGSSSEYLIVSVPESAQIGATLRLLAVASSSDDAEQAVAELDSGVTGRVAVLERTALFTRRVAVESVPVDDKITS
jgi:hypothetical protein